MRESRLRGLRTRCTASWPDAHAEDSGRRLSPRLSRLRHLGACVMAAWPGVLATILGGTAQGLPKGLGEAEDLALKQQQAAEQARQFETQQARLDSQFQQQQGNYQQQQERLTGMENTRLAERRAERADLLSEARRKESMEKDQLAGLSGILAGQAQTMPPGGPAAENDMPTVTDPSLLALSQVIPMLSRAGAERAIDDRFKPQEMKAPKAPEPFTLNRGDRRFDATGKMIAEGGPMEQQHRELTGGAQLDALVVQLQEARVRGDKNAVRDLSERVDALKRYITPPGGVAFGVSGNTYAG